MIRYQIFSCCYDIFDIFNLLIANAMVKDKCKIATIVSLEHASF